MATLKRVWYEGAIYHVTTRGNHQLDIFKGEADFKFYLSLVEEALLYYKEHNYEIICYCLMKNHVHLLIKTNKEPLGLLMSRINSIYTRYFNKKYECVGYLFQGRYYSDLINNDLQILEVSRYVHLNPVKANIVKKPQHYRWSNYRVFTGGDGDAISNPEIILNYFKHTEKYRLYKDFVEDKIG